MIQSKKELDFYIKADYMMNRGYFKPSFMQKLRNLFVPDYTMKYLVAMRKVSYYTRSGGISLLINKFRFRNFGIKLGFSIGPECFGLVIPHYGTIVVGDSNRCGNYCVLQTSTCISSNGKVIGNALYLGTGAKITTKVTLGDNVMIAANSVVNKSYEEGNCLLAGSPAIKKAFKAPWYSDEDDFYKSRFEAVEGLKINIFHGK